MGQLDGFYRWFKHLGGNVALLNVEELQRRLNTAEKRIKTRELKQFNYKFNTNKIVNKQVLY
jgi:hypothetical protein